MTELGPQDLVVQVKAAHTRERVLIGGLSEEQVRGPSALPGWSRGHVLAARLAFIRAANQQIDYAFSGDLPEFFYEGGREGRDAEIAANCDRPADELVPEVRQRLADLDARWSGLSESDWTRLVTYRRDDDTLLSVLQACWRESELHCVDLDLGVQPSDWSADLCRHLLVFLEQRVPDGLRLDLVADDGETWTFGTGERVQVRGALNDLAAWMAGRRPAGPVESSSGSLPLLQRLRDARRTKQ